MDYIPTVLLFVAVLALPLGAALGCLWDWLTGREEK